MTNENNISKNLQHESSITHRNNLKSGLNVVWERFTGHTDSDWSVVCYSNGSRWFFDNGGAEQLTLLGEVSDGLNKAEILENSIGAIIALYQAGPQSFESREAWIESLSEFDKPEAEALLANA